MSAEQHQITTDAATELAFLVNATAVSGVVAVGGLVSLVVQHRPYQLVGTVVGVLAARTFYSLAVGAARRLSVEVQVPAVDMLRLAMYKRLGVRVPTSPDEEMEVGTRVSHLYTRMEAIPAELRRDVAMPEEEVPPADATQPEVHNK